MNEVLTLAVALRSLGIDADLDLFHTHERGIDWSRWGPLQARVRDVVLVAVSEGWRERWEGTNDSRTGAGAVAEADALLGIFNNDGQEAFRKKVIVVVLPSMRAQRVIPDRLTGVNRVELDDFSEVSLKPLLHLLLEIPLHERPELGDLPDLTPVPRQTSSDGPQEDLEMLEDRIRVLRTTAAALAATSNRGARYRPYEQISLHVDAQLTELLKERTTRLGSDRLSHVRPAPPGLIAMLVLAIAAGAGAGVTLGSASGEAAGSAGKLLARHSPDATVSVESLPRPPASTSLPGLHRKPASHTSQSQASAGITAATSPAVTSTSSAPSSTVSPPPRTEQHTKTGGAGELHSESGGGA